MWKFDVGLTGPLETGDMVLMARWLLYRLGEDFGIVCSLAVRVH
jgi:glutamine synthetase